MAFKTFEFECVSDADGIIRLEIPVEQPGLYRVIITMESRDKPTTPRQWPPDFFEQTAGKWVGELERAPQGEFEQRDSFDP